MTMFNTSMADALFGGSKSVGTGSFFSASNFGDLALIKKDDEILRVQNDRRR